MRFGRPALECDFIELYRSSVDDFLIQYCQNLRPEDFIAKTEMWYGKKSRRIYLKKAKTDDLTNSLHRYFSRTVKVPRIMYGKQQELETLINEEALLLAKFLRNEKSSWTPRAVIPSV